MEKEIKKVLFYPWDVSKTGDWSPDTGIYLLRDESPEVLASILWDNGIYVLNSAIIELMAHGNSRKAADVARILVRDYPIVENSIRENFGNEGGDYLLNVPLEDIPSCPEEYPSDVRIEYVQ